MSYSALADFYILTKDIEECSVKVSNVETCAKYLSSLGINIENYSFSGSSLAKTFLEQYDASKKKACAVILWNFNWVHTPQNFLFWDKVYRQLCREEEVSDVALAQIYLWSVVEDG